MSACAVALTPEKQATGCAVQCGYGWEVLLELSDTLCSAVLYVRFCRNFRFAIINKAAFLQAAFIFALEIQCIALAYKLLVL